MPTPTGDPIPVALHVRVWNPGAARRVLVLHGLGSDSGTCWQLAEAVAAAGATAVVPDLRNHGLSPTTSDLRVTAYAADVALLADAWDLVIGHSLGGSVLAELCARPGFARRALLLDPVLLLHDEDRQPLRDGLRTEVGGRLTTQQLAQDQPNWSPEDIHRKVLGAATVSPRTTDLTCDHNDPWDVRGFVADWACSVHLVVADPTVGALCWPEDVEAALTAHPGVTASTIEGAGHSVHRDRPDVVARLVNETLAGR